MTKTERKEVVQVGESSAAARARLKNQIMEECVVTAVMAKRGGSVFNPLDEHEDLFEELVKEGRLTHNPMGEGYIFPDDHLALFRGRKGPVTREDVRRVPPEEYQDDTGPIAWYDDGAVLLRDGKTIELQDGTQLPKEQYYSEEVRKVRRRTRWWRRASRWIARKMGGA